MNQAVNVEVGILKGKQIRIRFSGKYLSGKDNDGYFGEYTAELSGDCIKLFNSERTLKCSDELSLIPCNLTADSFEIEDVVIGIDFHWEKKEKQNFQGALKLKKTDDHFIQVINVIPIENYLISVISSEMSENSSLQLLKAHAIISRTWVLKQIELKQKKSGINKGEKQSKEEIDWQDGNDHQDFHVCADDHCQRYQGISKNPNPNVIKAVNATRGQVLIYEHELCDARFSKSCGGHTEIFSSCWQDVDVPYLKGFRDVSEKEDKDWNLQDESNAKAFILDDVPAWCNTRDKDILKQVLKDYDFQTEDFYRWKIEYTQEEISSLLKEKSGIDFGEIKEFKVLERGVSGRIVKLKIIGTLHELVIGKELKIRKYLSKSHLYSSALIIETPDKKNNIPQKFILHGAGWGHGVGLCQIGAAVMAHNGVNYIDILKHYYKAAQVQKYYA